MNKKLLLILTMVVVILTPLVADTPADLNPGTNPIYAQAGQPYEGANIWSLSMGGAGLGMKGYSESFLKNPANLPNQGFQIAVPAVTVTGYNVKKILESSIIDDFTSGDENRLIDGADEFLKLIKRGDGDILTTDVTLLALNVGGLGVALQAQERLMTHKPTSDVTTIELIAQLTTAATVGFGYNIPIIEDWLDIDVGVSAQFVYKGYLQGLSADSLITDMFDEGGDAFDFGSFFIGNRPFAGGWSLPITVGANVNGPWGLSLSMVGRNINAKQYMTTYPSLNAWSIDTFGQPILDGDSGSGSTSTFEIDGKFTFDLGLTWSMNFGSNLLQPTISLDFIDFGQMAELDGDELSRAFWSTTRFGASVRVLNILDFRYGLNKGYQSIGLGIDLFVFHLDVAYYTLEYGSTLGKKPIDALSVRIGLLSR